MNFMMATAVFSYAAEFVHLIYASLNGATT